MTLLTPCASETRKALDLETYWSDAVRFIRIHTPGNNCVSCSALQSPKLTIIPSADKKLNEKRMDELVVDNPVPPSYESRLSDMDDIAVRRASPLRKL
jgi:hypothetical protein